VIKFQTWVPSLSPRASCLPVQSCHRHAGHVRPRCGSLRGAEGVAPPCLAFGSETLPDPYGRPYRWHTRTAEKLRGRVLVHICAGETYTGDMEAVLLGHWERKVGGKTSRLYRVIK
jgi:hypothetical protein